MAINFTTTKKENHFVKAMVYGEAGIGKTVLCSTAPSPVIISTESGLLSLADKDPIPVIEVGSAADIFEALAFIQSSADAKQFLTICLDSISDMAEVMLIDYKKQFKDPRQAYGVLADDMGTLIRSFRDLPNNHVYFTAKQGNLVDEYSGLIKYAPSMPGKNLTNGLPFFFDEVMVMRVQEGEGDESWRYLQTNATPQFTAKDRSGKLENIERPDLSYLFNKIVNSNKTSETKKEEPETHTEKPEIQTETPEQTQDIESPEQTIVNRFNN